MQFNWLNNMLGDSKSSKEAVYLKEIDVLKDKLHKVVEINKSLERQLKAKEQEVGKADKSILTIIQLWKNIKSSEPLSKVLSTILNGITHDLDYLYCILFQIHKDNNGAFLKAGVASDVKYFNLEEILGNSLSSYSIPYECDDNPLVYAIKTQKIKKLENFNDIFIGTGHNLTRITFDRLESIFIDRAITILPLTVNDESYGCIVAISLKKEINELEKNYLKLFAGQIELSVSMIELLERVQAQAVTDGLTKLYNRRYFNEYLTNEIKKSIRLRTPFTLISLDLDHLKHINDTYGHSAGDAAISSIANVLLQNVREIDVSARCGGEEFAVIMSGTDIEDGIIAAERLRSIIESKYVEGIGAITASIGVATFLKHANTQEELIELVDQAMYRAKKNGRNRVEIATAYVDFNWTQLGLEIFTDILNNKDLPIDVNISNDLIQKIESGISQNEDPSKLLYNIFTSLMKNYDPSCTSGIVSMKVELIEKIAAKINLSKYETDRTKLALILSDIGNIMIPKDILIKKEALTEDEKKKIVEHPSLTAKEILKPVKRTIISSLLSVIVHHHENWDGSGYPYKLSGEEIPIGCRIISLINAYTALISKKPYRKAYYPEEALDILNQGSNVQWDARLVNVLSKIIREKNS